MKLRDVLAALRRVLRKEPPERPIPPTETADDGEISLGPTGPLGPTGGQIGNPQRF